MLNVDVISGSKSGTSYSDRVLTVCTIGYKCHWSIPMHIVAFTGEGTVLRDSLTVRIPSWYKSCFKMNMTSQYYYRQNSKTLYYSQNKSDSVKKNLISEEGCLRHYF